MLQSIFGNSLLVLSTLVFLASVLLLEGLYLLWQTYKGPNVKKIERRLHVLSSANDNTEKTQLLRARMMSTLPVVERILLRMPRAHQIDRMILQANLNLSVSRLVLSSAVLGTTGFMLAATLLHQPFWAAACLAAVMCAGPFFFVQRRRNERLKKIETQIPEALELLSRALRAGHAFGAGLQMIAEEMAEPIASEFRFVHDEINFGVSLEQALTNLSARVPITDLRYFVVAVLIQRESGGNLTEVLTNLSRLIRQRLKLLWHIRILSAEGRLSAWVLGVMPFALAGLMNLMNPNFMAPLWNDPIGTAILRNMLLLMVLGVLVLRKITNIRV